MFTPRLPEPNEKNSFPVYPGGIYRATFSVILGDFNCVQSPLLDRLGLHRSCRPESLALEAFLKQSEWADARLMLYHAEEEEADDTVDHFTYWKGSGESRIDRFYVPHSWIAQVL